MYQKDIQISTNITLGDEKHEFRPGISEAAFAFRPSPEFARTFYRTVT